MKLSLVIWLGAALGIFLASLLSATFLHDMPLAPTAFFLTVVAPFDAFKAAIGFFVGSSLSRRLPTHRLVLNIGVVLGIVSVVAEDLTRIVHGGSLVSEVKWLVLAGGGLAFGLLVPAPKGQSRSGSDGARLWRLLTSSFLGIVFVAPLLVLLPFGLFTYVVEHSARPFELVFGSLILGADAAAAVAGLVLLGTFADNGSQALRATPQHLWTLCNVGVALTLLGCLAWLLEGTDYALGPPLNIIKLNVWGVFPLVVYVFLICQCHLYREAR